MEPVKLRIDRATFGDTIINVARTIPARPAIPILGGIHLAATETGLTVSAYDYEASTQVHTNAEVGDPGEAVVSGRLLAGIVKALPKKPVDVALDGSHLAITCGASRFTLPTMPVEDYPQIPRAPKSVGTVDVDTFAEAVAEVGGAAGKDDSLPMLTGIRVEIAGDTMTLAATDRFRLAVRTIPWQPDGDQSAAILAPAKTLTDTAKALTGDRVELSLDDNLLGVVSTGRRSTTRLLDSEYPKFRQLINHEHKTVVSFDVAPLAQAVKRVAVCAQRGVAVLLAITEGGITLSAGGDLGNAEEHVDATLTGAAITIQFNPTYLLDGLAALKGKRAHLGFTSPTRPGLLWAASDDEEDPDSDAADFVYLVMPVRIPQ